MSTWKPVGEPTTTSPGYDTTLSAAERKRTGAWYTPAALVRHVVAESVGHVVSGTVVRVLDPACGDGRFLFEAARVVRAQGGIPVLTGVDIDLGGLAVTTSHESVEAIRADALTHDWSGRYFDVVVGNPPFLSQMSSSTVRSARSGFGGGPYADAAAEFLGLSVRLARPDGGRVGLVLPMSLLTARDAGPIRADVQQRAVLRWFWWSTDVIFEANVRTCAIGVERCERTLVPSHSTPPADASPLAVTRTEGLSFTETARATPRSTVHLDGEVDNWGWLVADALGTPSLAPLRYNGSVAEHALVTANFRDQYYGLVGAVHDHGDGPPLITTGLIDVGRCRWGDRPTRFAKQKYLAPRVDRSGFPPFMQRWATRCLVPKVLVATQTRVLEAVADPHGAWLPAVPVIRLVPTATTDVWQLAAVLTSPAASAMVAELSAGSGLSASTVRVSQRTLNALPWPAGDVIAAADALREGDIGACGHLVDAAYGLDDDELFAWWWRGVEHGSRRDSPNN